VSSRSDGSAKWLSPRLAAFMQAHPHITIRLSSSAESADLLKDPALDADIACGLPSPCAGVAVEPLGREEIVPLASPRLVGESGAPTPRDVLRHTPIESKLNPVHWADWCRMNGLRLPDRARPSFDRGSLAVAAAVDGLGIALETTRFAQVELARGDLVVLDGPDFHRVIRDTHFLCYRRVDRDETRIVALREWLHAQLAAAPHAKRTRTQSVPAS
jgi:DNA-binding transcriptional LysR family regulator